ncbi:S8 family peptidase [Stutzerimonas stutzeri]|uniref:S8 family peptidase n=1 Tax=Stutzerimonas stutzeri TaxID=316 RepID=UPI000C99BA57|nr:S8 family peptidase [Stutzerimonas stutzeri]PNG13431.1 peptidase S8 and S53, subtilisin, kexin, sedolisin [Stutzerimonas stutzeri]
MESKERFLFGRGEKLADHVPYRGGFSKSTSPYTLHEQIGRVEPMLSNILDELDRTPTEELAKGNTVAALTLHPQYVSRSGFPVSLLREYSLRLVGSKPKKNKPETGRGSDKEEGIASTVLYVAGDKNSFKAFKSSLPTIEDGSPIAEDLVKIEKLETFSAQDRLLGEFDTDENTLEVIVHFDSAVDLEWEDDLLRYATKKNVSLNMARSYQTRGLLFLSAKGNKAAVDELAKFSFIRAIRRMPKLRTISKPHLLRSAGTTRLTIPTDKALDESFKIAVFDGGLPTDHPFGTWVNAIEPSSHFNIGAPVPKLLEHGQAVTSALLFGSIESGALERPYSEVDHYRVLGDQVNDDSLYDVMLYIDNVLSQTSYPLASFSIGPYQVAGDEEVTAWTSMLDDHLGEGDLLAAVAVGNDGEQDWPSSRIQVPSDSVNALAVGASTCAGLTWSRAPYSSIGPGRSPGLVKPDVLAFGGCDESKFRFIFPGPVIAEDCGTSFATPSVVRLAAGLRAYFGSALTTQAIKSLLIHSAQDDGYPRSEVGWGMVDPDIRRIVSCADGEIKVLYTGKLEPGKVLRAPIPLPDEELIGSVTIKATFCYSCATDPHTPGEYTRAGLDVKFRPHKDKFDPKQKKPDPRFPKTAAFFSRHDQSNEQELRTDAHKWDTVRSQAVNKQASSLMEPVFDIHYLAREPGKSESPARAPKLPYALVVTVISKKTPDLYEKVQAKYKALVEIQPKIQIPISLGV